MIGERQQKGTALILGGSRGLGLATAKKLAFHGYDIVLVHRDRKSDLEGIEASFQKITSIGVRLHTFNIDATRRDRMQTTISAISSALDHGNKINVLVHSLAKGSLKPMMANADQGPVLERTDFRITLEAMAISLYDWTKALIRAGLLAGDTRIIAFTSEGSTKAWPNYAAVSAAKASLEAIARSMALEFAPLGIRCNCIQAGVTETRSFAMIPGHETLRETTKIRNPHGRLTQPEDVANAAYLLTLPEAQWITGTIIKVDGGESLR